jgi:hypothetical protein
MPCEIASKLLRREFFDMKIRQTFLLVAFVSGLALLSMGCSKNSTGTTPNNSPDAVDNSAGAGETSTDTSPIPKEQFDQLKDLWSLQIEGVAAGAKTLTTINEEHKDAELGKMLKDLDAKLADLRDKLSKVTMTNGRQLMTVELPKEVGEASELAVKAQARMQEVLQAKFPQK